MFLNRKIADRGALRCGCAGLSQAILFKHVYLYKVSCLCLKLLLVHREMGSHRLLLLLASASRIKICSTSPTASPLLVSRSVSYGGYSLVCPRYMYSLRKHPIMPHRFSEIVSFKTCLQQSAELLKSF